MVSIFLFEFNSFTLKKEIKKGGIAPLQPAVLAAFRPWGILRGAGRTAAAKIRKICPTPSMARGLNRGPQSIQKSKKVKWNGIVRTHFNTVFNGIDGYRFFTGFYLFVSSANFKNQVLNLKISFAVQEYLMLIGNLTNPKAFPYTANLPLPLPQTKV